MFYEYAYANADKLEKWQLELYEKTGIAWNDRLARLDTLTDSDEEDANEDEDQDEDEDEDDNEESMEAEDYEDIQ